MSTGHGSLSNMIAAAVVVVVSGGNGVMTHQGTQEVRQIAADVHDIRRGVDLLQYRVDKLEEPDNGSRQRQ